MGEVPRGDPSLEESQDDGCATVRDRLSCFRLRRCGRSRQRDGGARGAQEDVTDWRSAAVQPGAGLPRSWRPRALARQPRAGARGRFADDGVDRLGCHIRSPPLRTAVRGAPEENGLQVTRNRAPRTSFGFDIRGLSHSADAMTDAKAPSFASRVGSPNPVRYHSVAAPSFSLQTLNG